MKEKWKDIIGYEGFYQISNLGKVRSLKRKGRGNTLVLKHKRSTKKKYDRVTLYKNKTHGDFIVHRLVAEAFHPNPYNYPEVDHIDGDKTNNCVDNLAWCTALINTRRAFKLGLRTDIGENKANAKLKNHEVLTIRRLWATGNWKQASIAEIYNIAHQTVSSIVNRKHWKHI